MSTFDYVLGVSDFQSGTVTLTGAPWAITRAGYSPSILPPEVPIVEEGVSFRLSAGSIAANGTALDELQRLLTRAARRQNNRTLPQVFIFYKQSAGADQYRSEIVRGEARLDASAFDRDYWEGDVQFGEMRIERVNYWEGPEAQVPLTNLNGTANTSGLNVFNTNDESGSSPNKRVNYVEVDAADVDGTLDGHTRLEIKNTYSTDLLYHLWIGHNYTDPSNLVWFYDANDATGGSAVSSASGSGGNYKNVDLVSGSEATMLTWSISTAQLDAFAGRLYKGMLRFVSTVDDRVRYRLRLQWRNSTLWQSSLVSLSGAVYATAIRELATFKMPPWVAGLTGQEPMELLLRGYHTAGGTITIPVDSLQITPVDGWRRVAFVGYGATANMWLYDDGITGRLYADDGAGGSAVGNLTGYGAPIMLRPSTTQRLYFQMHSNVLNQAELARSVQVKVYYRPRRHTL